MPHTVSSYSQTKLEGGLQRCHSADDVAVKWLNAYNNMRMTDKPADMHSDLSSLKDCLRLEILVMSRVLYVGLDPADVLTSTETPLLQTLNNTTSCTLQRHRGTHHLCIRDSVVLSQQVARIIALWLP